MRMLILTMLILRMKSRKRRSNSRVNKEQPPSFIEGYIWLDGASSRAMCPLNHIKEEEFNRAPLFVVPRQIAKRFDTPGRGVLYGML